MKLRYVSIGALAIYIAGVFAFRPAVVRAATPPLKTKFDEIGAFTYAYYDKHGDIPKTTDYLPGSLRGLIGTATGITWNASEQAYHYQYPEKYPKNVSPVEIATFGFIRSERNNLGSSITPEMIRVNTPLYKKAGRLPSLTE